MKIHLGFIASGLCMAALIGSSSTNKQIDMEGFSMSAASKTQVKNANQTMAQAIHQQRKSHGKPGSHVEVMSPTIIELDLDSFIDTQIELTTGIKAGTLDITIATSDGLTLLSNQKQWQFQLEDQPNLTLPISVRSQSEKRHNVHVFVQHTDPLGNQSARSLAVVFESRASIQNKHFSKSTKAIVADVVVLPGQENIY